AAGGKAATVQARAERDLPRVGGIPQGVGEEIGEDLPDRGCIGLNDSSGGVEFEGEPDRPSAPAGVELLPDLSSGALQLDFGGLRPPAACLDTREVQQIVDDALEPLCVLLHD